MEEESKNVSENSAEGTAKDTDWRALYEQEHSAFAAYRREADDRAEQAEKRRLYEGLLRRAGIEERRIGTVLRAADLDGVRLRAGKLDDEAGLLRQIRREWGDFIPGWERAETPPAGGPAVTRESILRTRDTAERQQLIARNHELFGF